MAGSAGDYWWGGAFRTLFVVDPLRELVAVLLANETVYQPILRWLQLFRTLAYQSIAQ